MNIGFEKIWPTPTYPAGTSAAALLGHSWSSQSNAVEAFKTGVKTSLRQTQLGRCCFCRRLLYDDYATHLEHFIDKGTYPQYQFEILNLALACGTCNIRKNGHFASWNRRYRFMTRSFVGPMPAARCPVLATQLVPGGAFPSQEAQFRWVNPHVHKYSSHISLGKGWIFTGSTRTGKRTVRGLKLNAIAEIEQRALSERLLARGGVLSTVVGAIASMNHHRAIEAAKIAVKVIKRRRQAALAGK